MAVQQFGCTKKLAKNHSILMLYYFLKAQQSYKPYYILVHIAPIFPA